MSTQKQIDANRLWNRCLDTMADHEPYRLGRSAGVLSSTFDKLQRRLDSADRAYRRSLELLLELQAQRSQPVTQPNGFVPAKPPKPVNPGDSQLPPSAPYLVDSVQLAGPNELHLRRSPSAVRD